MRPILFALILAASTLGYRPDAEACGNETYYVLDDAARDLADAESLLDKGRYVQAVWKANRVDVKGAHIEDRARFRYSQEHYQIAPEVRRQQLEARKQRVLGIAQVRLGNYKLAKAKLAGLVKATPDDPVLQARYAEALIGSGNKDEGKTILVDLAARDLVPDAHAWVALAKLHDKAGETEARDRAVTGCKAIATDAKACVLKPAKRAKAAATS